MRPNKYRNQITEVDGRKFHSKKEAKRYQELKLLERGGLITNLQCQPRFEIVIDAKQVRYAESKRPMFYVADFSYFDKQNFVVEDVKGMKTPDYKIKRALVEHIYGFTIREL